MGQARPQIRPKEELLKLPAAGNRYLDAINSISRALGSVGCVALPSKTKAAKKNSEPTDMSLVV